MYRKQSESELSLMMRKRYHAWAYKGRDRGYVTCPQCGKLISECPFCHKDMLLPKGKTMPDYIVAFDWIYIECKQGHESWSVLDFTDTQLSVMREHYRQGGEGYLFLELGDGNVLHGGRQAWLVEWASWLEIQKMMLDNGHKSMRLEATARSRLPIASEVLEGYELAWESGGWSIPEAHIFWANRQQRTKGQMEKIVRFFK